VTDEWPVIKGEDGAEAYLTTKQMKVLEKILIHLHTRARAGKPTIFHVGVVCTGPDGLAFCRFGFSPNPPIKEDQ
jgi:hypothetical protein